VVGEGRRSIMQKDRVLTGATMLLRLMLVMNIVLLVMFTVALALSWPLGHALALRLGAKYGPSLNVADAVTAMRLMMVLGIASALPIHPIFVSLLRIVATVQAGDPFVDANATLLGRIGWALLVFQCLDLVLGALMRWISALKLDATGWSPSLGGWIAVVMIFVLARVFRIGARMRDDLATTV
jgi:hypothetical protein